MPLYKVTIDYFYINWQYKTIWRTIPQCSN